ncbi:putative reverse transcriptase domain-containing protein [Tanacetum coccineum]
MSVPIVPAEPRVTPEWGQFQSSHLPRVLDFVDYSLLLILDHRGFFTSVPDLPLVSPFLCSDDSEADGESEPAEQRPVSLSHDTLALLSEFPLAPVVAPPGIQEIRPIPARILAWKHVSHHSSNRHSSPDSSSSSSPSDRSLSGHAPPDTTDANSSTPQRFVHRSLARTPRHSSSSERSLDSSSPSSRSSRKRCRSPTASVPSPTLILSGAEHMEVDTTNAEVVADVGISEGVVSHPEDGVGIGFEIAASNVREDDEEFEAEASAADTREIVVDPLAIGDSSESSIGGIPNLEDTIYDIVHYMSEVHIDRITEIETTQRQLETSHIERDRIDSLRWHMALLQEEFHQVCRDRDDTRRRLRRLESTMNITRSCMTPEAIEELVNRRVEETLAAYEATRAANALEAENQSQNGSDGNNGNGGNGNGENGNGENGNPNENGRGVVGLIRWFENMEAVFHISNCPEKYQVKFATCTLLNSALSWWNSHNRTIRTEAAFAMSWRELMKLMTKVYCLRNEIQKMESELWNLTVKNNNLAAYTRRFQELTKMCTKMVLEEEDRVEKFIGGLPDNIHGNVIAAEPTRL